MRFGRAAGLERRNKIPHPYKPLPRPDLSVGRPARAPRKKRTYPMQEPTFGDVAHGGHFGGGVGGHERGRDVAPVVGAPPHGADAVGVSLMRDGQQPPFGMQFSSGTGWGGFTTPRNVLHRSPVILSVFDLCEEQDLRRHFAVQKRPKGSVRS